VVLTVVQVAAAQVVWDWIQTTGVLQQALVITVVSDFSIVLVELLLTTQVAVEVGLAMLLLVLAGSVVAVPEAQMQAVTDLLEHKILAVAAVAQVQALVALVDQVL
jgi:hypothetical protein